ncbi:MAG: hypothetical protein R3264_13905, partial [Anaerolineae bacterium]|nr:hypothetical protein [Anaerolineae bacterium]
VEIERLLDAYDNRFMRVVRLDTEIADWQQEMAGLVGHIEALADDIDATARSEAALQMRQAGDVAAQTGLDDFYSQYEFRVYIAFTDNPVEKATILNALIQNIQAAFGQAGVSLSSPHLIQLDPEAG